MGRTVYRGGDIEEFNDTLLRRGRIEGGTSHIFHADPAYPEKHVEKRTPVSEVPFDSDGLGASESVGITGGVSDDITATRRFRGTYGLVAVMDAAATPFEKVQYDPEWMENHPGTLEHILTTADGEIYLPDGRLWAILDQRPSGAYHIDHWGRDNLPATNPNSRFADESEWIAQSSSVDVMKALDGLVSVWDGRGPGVRYRSMHDDVDDILDNEAVVPEVYDHVRDQLHRVIEPFYLLVTQKGADSSPGGYSPEEIELAYDGDQFLDPASVPAKFRGEA